MRFIFSERCNIFFDLQRFSLFLLNSFSNEQKSKLIMRHVGLEAVQNLGSNFPPKICMEDSGSDVKPCIQRPFLRSKATKVDPKPRRTSIRMLQSVF
jgi:hypothetical protein